MREMMLTVVDAIKAIHGMVRERVVAAVAAALAASPETVEELETAVGRFIRPCEGQGLFGGFHPGACDEARDAGVVVVDLPARFLAADCARSLPRRDGQVEYCDGETATDVWIPYQVPEDWRFRRSVRDWRAIAAARRTERAAVPPLDARRVLYGEVAGFIARECQAALASGAEEPLAAIHARWLTTPRADLRDQSPRDVLLERHHEVDLDLQWRELQWSFVGEPPASVSPESAAFRYAGFGTHENVIYYDMVRHLLGECWRRLRAEGPVPADAETERLNRLMHEWLYAPQEEDLHGMTPFYVIACERSRMPLALSGKSLVIDDDCPLCQMLAESAHPTFWHLDGCNMDDDFAFSFHRTREEWEEERREWDEWSRKWEEERASERARQGPDAPSPVWTSSHVDWDAFEALPREEALGLALVGVGAHVGELVTALRGVERGSDLIESLNQSYAELRDAVSGDTRWLARIVIRQFREELDELGDAQPGLAARCADLSGRLAWLSERVGD